MNEVNRIPKMGDFEEINRLGILKGIGRENIQPVLFSLEANNETVIEDFVDRHEGEGCCSKHFPREDLMEELLDAIGDINASDLQYLETLQESSDDIFSRTVSYICIPLVVMDLTRSLGNIDSNRKLARAARAYRKYIVAITKDLETQIDEKLLVRAFQSDNSNLASANDDWLTNALILELRRAKNSSQLDLGHFVNFILFDMKQGVALKSQVIEGVANRIIRTRLSTRIGTSRSKVKLSATEAFASMQVNKKLNLFDSLLASDSFSGSGFLTELIDYLTNSSQSNMRNQISSFAN